MSKIDSLMAMVKANEMKVNELLRKKEKEEVEAKKSNTWAWIIGIIVAVLVIAAIVYAVYKFMQPEYLEDFEDEFEDDFEDDLEFPEEDIEGEFVEE